VYGAEAKTTICCNHFRSSWRVTDVIRRLHSLRIGPSGINGCNGNLTTITPLALVFAAESDSAILRTGRRSVMATRFRVPRPLLSNSSAKCLHCEFTRVFDPSFHSYCNASVSPTTIPAACVGHTDFLSIMKFSSTKTSISLLEKVLKALAGVFTIGSPFRLNEVFSTTGTPVDCPKRSISL
jgi:hypothetical protein